MYMTIAYPGYVTRKWIAEPTSYQTRRMHASCQARLAGLEDKDVCSLHLSSILESRLEVSVDVHTLDRTQRPDEARLHSQTTRSTRWQHGVVWETSEMSVRLHAASKMVCSLLHAIACCGRGSSRRDRYLLLGVKSQGVHKVWVLLYVVAFFF